MGSGPWGYYIFIRWSVDVLKFFIDIYSTSIEAENMQRDVYYNLQKYPSIILLIINRSGRRWPRKIHIIKIFFDRIYIAKLLPIALLVLPCSSRVPIYDAVVFLMFIFQNVFAIGYYNRSLSFITHRPVHYRITQSREKFSGVYNTSTV